MVGLCLYQAADLVSVGAARCRAWEGLAAERLIAVRHPHLGEFAARQLGSNG